MLRLIFIGGFLVGSFMVSESVGGISLALQAERQELVASVARRIAGGESAKSAPIVDVTDETFEKEVLQAPGNVLLHFWADWSGSSKIIAPALEDMALEMGDVVTFARINVDESPATPDKLGIRGVPTLLLFRNGQIAGKKVGAAPKDLLIEWVESVLDE